MCKMCLEVREASIVNTPVAAAVGEGSSAGAAVAGAHTPSHFPQWDEDLVPDLDESGSRDLVSTFLFAIVCLSMIAVIGVLVWQVISLLRIVTSA